MRVLRRIFRAVLLLAAILVAAVSCQNYRYGLGPELVEPAGSSLRIATYNVHYINARSRDGRWGLEGWEARKDPLARAVGVLQADVIAFQEMETFRGGNDDSENLARAHLLAQHPGYAAAAIGNWREFPSTQPIFYRAARFDVLDEGWFFFSETPDVIYSRSFNGSYPAFASWARFRDRQGGGTFRVVNLHTDFASRENRVRSVDLVARRVAPWVAAGEAVFVAGDLNALPGSGLHDRLEEVGLAFAPVRGATYHFDLGVNLFGPIDHIAHAGVTPAGPPVVVRDRFGAVWPTDHYPLVADFILD